MAIVVWKEKQFCFGCCKNELNQIWTREEKEMGPFPPFDVFSVGVVSDGHTHKKLFQQSSLEYSWHETSLIWIWFLLSIFLP